MKNERLRNVYLGPEYDDDAVKKVVEKANSRPSTLVKTLTQ
jgi:predicted NodU family carbamoyl transferase